MPVNYEQLHTQMKNAGKTLRLRHDAFSRAAVRYEKELRTAASDEKLKDRIEVLHAEQALTDKNVSPTTAHLQELEQLVHHYYLQYHLER